MARKKQTEYDDDDGRVIFDMTPVSSVDITGKVWPNRSDQEETKEETKTQLSTAQAPQLTKSEARRFTWSAMLAGLVVALVFSTVWVLFTLFATKIWFR
ncbi:MAG: hypothetical protein SVR81_07110 [Chloroflexota bacterium]|nr:hypothetical protein [Chloroflexota bacterium]